MIIGLVISESLRLLMSINVRVDRHGTVLCTLIFGQGQRAYSRADAFTGVSSERQMNEAHQFALVMFVLACAGVTLVAGQLYVEYSATHAAVAASSQTASVKMPRVTLASRSSQ